MSEAIPYLTIQRPVLNIGQERMDDLRGRLLEEAVTEGFDFRPASVIEGMFKAADELCANILAKPEFLRLQRNLGDDRLDEAGVRELEAKIMSSLATNPGDISTHTTPSKTEHWGEAPRFKLNVARNSEDIARDRSKVRNTLVDFFGMELWRDKGHLARTRKITPVELAHSSTYEQLKMLTVLKRIVDGEAILPAVTKLGAPDPEVDFQYVKG